MGRGWTGYIRGEGCLLGVFFASVSDILEQRVDELCSMAELKSRKANAA